MPRKQPVIEENPPVDSSSSSSSSSEEQNDAVEEVEETPVKKSAVNPSSDNDTDSDTDSTETQPSPTASAFTIKPRDGLATAANTKTKTIASKRKAKADPIVEQTESKNNDNKNKKAKAAAGSIGRGGDGGGGGGREGKRGTGTVQRLWSEDDEIAILKGLSEYRGIKGANPSADIGGFYEFIKKSSDLSFELSKPQLVDKIYRLKKKYKANVAKAGDDDPVLTKPREQRAFELSKKIWGPDASIHNEVRVDSGKSSKLKLKLAKTRTASSTSTSTSTRPPLGVTLALPNRKNPLFHPEKKVSGEVKDNGEANLEQVTETEADAGAEISCGEENGGQVKSNFWCKFPQSNLSLDLEKILAQPEFGSSFMTGIGGDVAMELENNWRDLQEKELELYLNRIDLAKQQAQLALDVLRGSRS